MYVRAGRVLVGNKEVSIEDLFSTYSRDPNDWIKFVVLYDLRSRGRKAKAGYSSNTLIYEHNGKYMVYVTEENAPITPNDIVNWVSSALSKGYEPLLAVVDAHGDVTYYKILNVRARELAEVIISET